MDMLTTSKNFTHHFHANIHVNLNNIERGFLIIIQCKQNQHYTTTPLEALSNDFYINFPHTCNKIFEINFRKSLVIKHVSMCQPSHENDK